MCVPVRRSRLELAVDERAPSRARAFLEASRCPEVDPEVVDECLLLVSEVVTNAVRHAGPPLVLEVGCAGPRGLGVRVSDGSPALPRQTTTSHPDDESGRGVALVDLLSDTWGVETSPDSKTIWFCLRHHDDDHDTHQETSGALHPAHRGSGDLPGAGGI